MAKQLITKGVLCLILFCLVLVPSVSALVQYLEVPESSDPLARDSPENIAALKNHIAYIGGSQEARMDGVIAYIETISGNAGIGNLRVIKSDYLAAAATIPAMKTADQINSLRDEMCIQSGRFAEETQARLLLINGSSDMMQKHIAISLNAFDLSLAGMTDPLWLSQTTARVTVFGRESSERNFTLRNFEEHGINIKEARIIADRIDAIRPALEGALNEDKPESVLEINTRIKSLNQQYRNTIAGYRERQGLSS